MEVENQTLDPLRSEFKAISHNKPYKISKETFEFKVIYMRIVSSSDMQSCMSLIFPPRDLHTCLQINGMKIHPNEKISRHLKRHRSDALMSESIYVNTDRIKFRGSFLPFQVHIQDSSSLVSGILRKMGDGLVDSKDDCSWVMDCKEGEVRDIHGGLVDVYFAGRSLGIPVLLNGMVELKNRWKGLDCIPEGDETVCGNTKESGEKPITEFDVKNDDLEEYLVEEEGELSWFNAGVRVGMGLGLGMCLGVGVGLGLIIRTYRATSGAFRRFI
ncbi:hypothetical protein HHK36_014464 [Tetracentron sinense]|uniref:Uncharacterized protein n=1 Tax=Tetracentron sinense TaxID=13715 RepID=A0A834Z849_TETSI|nr:hypothetical protein HHK36_014464 [Tetracentron sinense]